MRRYEANLAGLEAAKKIRREFHDKPPGRQHEVEWEWPKRVEYLGECKAVMYSSNKWEKNPKSFHDYKHVSEGPQYAFVNPAFELRGIEPEGPSIPVVNMPRAFAVLDKILGVQVCQDDADYYQIDIARCMLGAAESRDGKHTFLIVYSAGRDGACHMIITGDKLGVTKDGIVG